MPTLFLYRSFFDKKYIQNIACECVLENIYVNSRVEFVTHFNSTQEHGLPFDLAEVRIHLALTFTRSEPLRFLFWRLYERLNEKKNPASISQMNEKVKDIIESIPAEILQRVIGQFSRRIRNCILTREGLFESK